MPISQEEQIRLALSHARIGTFEAATGSGAPLSDALALYAWNAQISAAFLAPLHICEVVVRNAVAAALEAVYGDRWPWSPVFEDSLPNPGGSHFNPRRELRRARDGQASTGKVVAELKMVFWQKMFTGRFDGRLWIAHLKRVMPHDNSSVSVQQLRGRVHADLEQLRVLRNRIAHHEPIFGRSLEDDFEKIERLIGLCCPTTAAWMVANQQAKPLFGLRPGQ